MIRKITYFIMAYFVIGFLIPRPIFSLSDSSTEYMRVPALARYQNDEFYHCIGLSNGYAAIGDLSAAIRYRKRADNASDSAKYWLSVADSITVKFSTDSAKYMSVVKKVFPFRK